MPITTIELYRKSQNDFLEKRYDQALAGFATLVKNCPEHLWSRFQIGKILEVMRKINRAFEVYEFLASHCIKAGYPLLGFIAAKRAERMQTGLDEVLESMAELYSLESDRIDDNVLPQPIAELKPDMIITESVEVDEKLAANAEQLAKLVPDNRYPKQLPTLPLFSLLTLEAFFPVLDIIEAKSYKPSQHIIKQGDPADSFFLLAYGKVEIFQSDPDQEKILSILEPGSVFGEMSLITIDSRVASARAQTECEILELRLEDIEAIAEENYDINSALTKFTRECFLNHLFATSPVLTPFDRAERLELFDRFTSVGVPSGDVIIHGGKPGPGLYFILAGEAQITYSDRSAVIVKEGSVFGEDILAYDKPCDATVTATRGGEFLYLPKEDFQEVVDNHIKIQETLRGLDPESLKPRQTNGRFSTGLSPASHILI